MAQHHVADLMPVGVVDRLEMVHVDQHDIQQGAVAPGFLLVQRVVVLDAVAQGQPGQRIASHGAGQDQGLEVGQQADQFGLRPFKTVQVSGMPRCAAHDLRAQRSNGVMHGLVHRFDALGGWRIQRFELAPVFHEPGAETAQGMRHGIEHILAGRRAQHGAAQNAAGPVHMRFDSRIELGDEDIGFGGQVNHAWFPNLSFVSVGQLS